MHRRKPRRPAARPPAATTRKAREISRVRREMSGRNAAVRDEAAALPQLRETHEGIDQIVVRGKLERVDAGVAKSSADVLLAPFGRCRKALAKTPVVRVDENLLAALGVL